MTEEQGDEWAGIPPDPIDPSDLPDEFTEESFGKLRMGQIRAIREGRVDLNELQQTSFDQQYAAWTQRFNALLSPALQKFRDSFPTAEQLAPGIAELSRSIQRRYAPMLDLTSRLNINPPRTVEFAKYLEPIPTWSEGAASADVEHATPPASSSSVSAREAAETLVPALAEHLNSMADGVRKLTVRANEVDDRRRREASFGMLISGVFVAQLALQVANTNCLWLRVGVAAGGLLVGVFLGAWAVPRLYDAWRAGRGEDT